MSETNETVTIDRVRDKALAQVIADLLTPDTNPTTEED